MASAGATHTALSRGVGPRLVSPTPEPAPAASAEPARVAPTRDELLTRQAALRRARGQAALDGASFDGHAELAEIETALAVGEDAEAESVRRADAAAVQAAADRHARYAARVGGLTLAISDALRVAQTDMQSAVRGLLRVRELSQEIAELARRAGAPVAASLARFEQNERMGAMAAEALWPLRGDLRSLGDLEWQVTPFSFADWAAAEREATAGDLAATVERSTP
jgi:hypothetical protein